MKSYQEKSIQLFRILFENEIRVILKGFLENPLLGPQFELRSIHENPDLYIDKVKQMVQKWAQVRALFTPAYQTRETQFNHLSEIIMNEIFNEMVEGHESALEKTDKNISAFETISSGFTAAPSPDQTNQK